MFDWLSVYLDYSIGAGSTLNDSVLCACEYSGDRMCNILEIISVDQGAIRWRHRSLLRQEDLVILAKLIFANRCGGLRFSLQ
jgi:hypothetical protein